jgi:hypothetical protein
MGNPQHLDIEGTYIMDDLGLVEIDLEYKTVNGSVKGFIRFEEDHAFWNNLILTAIQPRHLYWWDPTLKIQTKWTFCDDDEVVKIYEHLFQVYNNQTYEKKVLVSEAGYPHLEQEKTETPPRRYMKVVSNKPAMVPKEESPQIELNTQLKSSDINQLSIAELKDQDLLETHLIQFEGLCCALGVMVVHGDEITVTPRFKIPLMLKLLESLKEVTTVSNFLMQNLTRIQYDFKTAKTLLIKTFCSRKTLKLSYLKRLSELKFTGIPRLEQYIAKASTIVSIARSLYNESKLELGPVIREILGKLDDDIRNRLLDKLFELTSDGESWETILPFDEMNASTINGHVHYADVTTIAELVRQTCHEVDERKAMLKSGTPGQKSDTARRVYTDSTEDWSKKFKSVLILFGPATKESELLKTKGFDVRIMMSRNKTPYLLLGSNKDMDSSRKVLKSLGEKFSARAEEFQLKNTKNVEEDPK